MGKKKKKKRTAFLKKSKKREKHIPKDSSPEKDKAKKEGGDSIKTLDAKESFSKNKKEAGTKKKSIRRRVFWAKLWRSKKNLLSSVLGDFNKRWWIRPWEAPGYWRWMVGLVWGSTLALFIVVINGMFFYWVNSLESLSKPLARVVPYPVAWIDGHQEVIVSSELLYNTAALRKFYQSQDYAAIGLRVDFSTPQGKKRLKIKEKDVLDKLLENQLIRIIAQEKGIQVTTSEAQEALKKSIEEHGDKRSLEATLKMLYGWSLEDFRNQVVRNQLYQEKLFEYYVGGIRESEDYREAIEVQNKINPDGNNFSQLAKEYSQGESAGNGGELGWFRRDQLIGQVGEVAFSLKKGEISQVIISELGFHVIQVQDRRLIDKSQAGGDLEGEVNNQEGESLEEGIDPADNGNKKTEEVKIRQIFIRNQSFLGWIKEEKSKFEINIWGDDYYWDQEQARVRFKDSEMEKLEQKLREESGSDPSLWWN